MTPDKGRKRKSKSIAFRNSLKPHLMPLLNSIVKAESRC